MPLATQTPVLARGFDILFDQKLAPSTTVDSARVWAQAYTTYAVSAGIVSASTKEALLASALSTAFTPELAGGGPPLFIQALSVFWIGLPIPFPPFNGGIVTAVAPSGSVSSPQPDTATPIQQADGLAQTIAAFTLSSVWVTPIPIPPGVPTLIL